MRFARERGLHVNAYVDDALYVEEDDRWTRWTTGYAKVDATLVDDLLDGRAARADEARDRGGARRGGAVAPEVTRRFAGALRAATSLPHFVEINAAGVTKAGTLEWLRDERLDVSPARTVACGDGLNDVDMLDGPPSAWRWRRAPKARRGASRELAGDRAPRLRRPLPAAWPRHRWWTRA